MTVIAASQLRSRALPGKSIRNHSWQRLLLDGEPASNGRAHHALEFSEARQPGSASIEPTDEVSGRAAEHRRQKRMEDDPFADQPRFVVHAELELVHAGGRIE